MRFNDGARATGMRLIKFGLVKTCLHKRAYFLPQNGEKNYLLATWQDFRLEARLLTCRS